MTPEPASTAAGSPSSTPSGGRPGGLRGLIRIAVVVALLALAALGLARAATAPDPTGADRADEVARSLACPVCEGQSVADSETEVAQAMRAAIREQVDAGRSKGQITAWFAERYGTSVLLDPPGRGRTAPLWLVPLGVLGGGALLVVAARRGRRSAVLLVTAAALPVLGFTSAWWTTSPAAPVRAGDTSCPAPGEASPPTPAPGGEASRSAVVATWLRTAAACEQQERWTHAAGAYRRARALEPENPQIALRLGTALLRGGDLVGAEQAARDALARGGRTADALLVLGLAQRAQGRVQEADRTLRDFLSQAPRHPAADGVRRVLGSS